MKKSGLIAVLAVLGTVTVFAQTPQNGFYFAQARQYVGGWRDQVVLRVQGGKITSANWNSVGLGAGLPDRKAAAKAGKDTSGWAAQAEKAEAFLVSSQNSNAASVAGVTIPVEPFFTLVKNALAAGPVPKGIYGKDGWYYAQTPAADSFQTINTAVITVVNGTIKDVLWNGILQMKVPDPSKINTSVAGGYPMKATQGAWQVQATKAAAALVNVQDPAKIVVKADGKTDAIAGVTIQVKGFLTAASLALQGAK
jgi:major membrane immunogen (membrane-anchored lipoprotein)